MLVCGKSTNGCLCTHRCECEHESSEISVGSVRWEPGYRVLNGFPAEESLVFLLGRIAWADSVL